jgi:hypothetical protein
VADAIPFKYRAFLSYSHRDKAWVKWLHSALEGYCIDKDLIGRDTLVGPAQEPLHQSIGATSIPLGSEPRVRLPLRGVKVLLRFLRLARFA